MTLKEVTTSWIKLSRQTRSVRLLCRRSDPSISKGCTARFVSRTFVNAMNFCDRGNEARATEVIKRAIDSSTNEAEMAHLYCMLLSAELQQKVMSQQVDARN